MIYSCQRHAPAWECLHGHHWAFPRGSVGTRGSRISTGHSPRGRGSYQGEAVLAVWESRPRDDGCLNRGWPGVGVLFCLQLPALMGRGLKGDLA